MVDVKFFYFQWSQYFLEIVNLIHFYIITFRHHMITGFQIMSVQHVANSNLLQLYNILFSQQSIRI